MTAASVQRALYGAFGLTPPGPPPAPAAPERFPIFSRPDTRRPVPFNPQRLALGGAITTNHKRESFF